MAPEITAETRIADLEQDLGTLEWHVEDLERAIEQAIDELRFCTDPDWHVDRALDILRRAL